MAKSIFITGANRGIGLEIVRQLVKNNNAPQHLFATCRNLEKAEQLQELAQSHKNVHVIKLDVRDYASYGSAVDFVKNTVKDDGLNVLINNAGVSSKFGRVNLVKVEQMLENFEVNTVSPLMLTKALLPLLKTAALKNEDKDIGWARSAVINTSSILGSICENETGGFYPYRCSKAALNAVTRSLYHDLKEDGILVVSLHPGWLKTDMGGKGAPLTVEQGVSGILTTLPSLTQKQNGCFVQYDGKLLPW